MDIFESLENLNVSEECFNDIMELVEKVIFEWDENRFREYKQNKESYLQRIDNEKRQLNRGNSALNSATQKLLNAKNEKQQQKAFNRVLKTRVSRVPNTPLNNHAAISSFNKMNKVNYEN